MSLTTKYDIIYEYQSLRSDDATACPDPSLARTVFQGFCGNRTVHVIAFHHIIVNANTIQGPGPAFVTFQGPVFNAWPSQQLSTVPLFRLSTPGGLDQLFMVGKDAQTPPFMDGFSALDISAWVFNSSVCGSVPLMSAILSAQTDHYYTTDPDEHSGLLADGWTDGGVVAFVLPLPTS
jgi:hypothetical protein